jgi:hypothetical protein
MLERPRQLSRLGAEHLAALADYFQEHADELALWARERAASEQMEAAARRRVERFAELPRLVLNYQAAGMSADAAIRAAAVAAGCEVETVIAWLTDRRRAERRRRRELLELQVMRLAGRGWTNKVIARRLGLHPGSVSRILQRVLRRHLVHFAADDTAE